MYQIFVQCHEHLGELFLEASTFRTFYSGSEEWWAVLKYLVRK